MKAKRILSLLLTAAMMLTCVTAFAAPAGYVQTYVFGPTYDSTAVLAQSINANAVAPDVNNVVLDIDVKKITDDEANAIGCKPASKYSGMAYLVTFKISNLGTLYSEYNEDWGVFGGGFGLTDVKFNLISPNTNYSIKNPASDITFAFKKNSSDAKIANFIVSNDPNAEGTFAYPRYTEEESTLAENASVEFQTVICAEADTVVEVDNANVMLTNYIFDEDSEQIVPKTMDGEGYNAIQIALWHPATITLGEAKEEETTPAVSGTAAVNKSGVMTEDGSVRYDNAYEIKVTLTAAAGGAVGVEFVPAFMADSVKEGDIWQFAAETDVYSEALGEGEKEFRAALIGVPVDVKGAEFQMLARAFVKNSEGKKTYGEVVTGDFQYTIPK